MSGPSAVVDTTTDPSSVQPYPHYYGLNKDLTFDHQAFLPWLARRVPGMAVATAPLLWLCLLPKDQTLADLACLRERVAAAATESLMPVLYAVLQQVFQLGVAAAPVLAVLALLYQYTQVFATRIVSSGNRKVAFLRNRMPTLFRPYYPTPWLFNGHLQSIIGTMLVKHRQPPFSREPVPISDGAIVYLDWVVDRERAHDSSDPIVILNHGLTGGSSDTYLHRVSMHLSRLGFRPVIFNARGCGDTPLHTQRGFFGCDTLDFRHVVDHIAAKHEGARLLCIGYSMGGNILAKYLSEVGDATPLTAAVTVSNPMDVVATIDALKSDWLNHRTYEWFMLGNLKKMILEKHPHWYAHNRGYSLATVRSVETIFELDSKVTCHDAGYESVHGYYAESYIADKLRRVAIPMLTVVSTDDPIIPEASIPEAEYRLNPNLMLAVTQRGGHLGYFSGLWPSGRTQWIDHVLGEYLLAALDLAATLRWQPHHHTVRVPQALPNPHVSQVELARISSRATLSTSMSDASSVADGMASAYSLAATPRASPVFATPRVASRRSVLARQTSSTSHTPRRLAVGEVPAFSTPVPRSNRADGSSDVADAVSVTTAAAAATGTDSGAGQQAGRPRHSPDVLLELKRFQHSLDEMTMALAQQQAQRTGSAGVVADLASTVKKQQVTMTTEVAQLRKRLDQVAAQASSAAQDKQQTAPSPWSHVAMGIALGVLATVPVYRLFRPRR